MSTRTKVLNIVSLDDAEAEKEWAQLGEHDLQEIKEQLDVANARNLKEKIRRKREIYGDMSRNPFAWPIKYAYDENKLYHKTEEAVLRVVVKR